MDNKVCIRTEVEGASGMLTESRNRKKASSRRVLSITTCRDSTHTSLAHTRGSDGGGDRRGKEEWAEE